MWSSNSNNNTATNNSNNGGGAAPSAGGGAVANVGGGVDGPSWSRYNGGVGRSAGMFPDNGGSDQLMESQNTISSLLSSMSSFRGSGVVGAPGSPTRRRGNLVDMIQSDFPRTPSPVFGAQLAQMAKLDSSRNSLITTAASNAASSVQSEWAENRVTSSTPPPIASNMSVPPQRSSSTPPVLQNKLIQPQNGMAFAPQASFASGVREEDILSSAFSQLQFNGSGNRNDLLQQSQYSDWLGSSQSSYMSQQQRVPYDMPVRRSVSPEPWNQYPDRSQQSQYLPQQLQQGYDNRDYHPQNMYPQQQQHQSHRGARYGNNDEYQQQQHHSHNQRQPHRGSAHNAHHNGYSNHHQQQSHGPRGDKNSQNNAANNANRSAILEEFRSSKNKRFDLKDILGYAVEFSGDQHGSRFIQQKLESSSEEEKRLVFEELLPQSYALMTDVFGNYVIQKYFEYGNDEHKRALVDVMKGNIITLSLQ
eukprot:Partr_v1_DN27420_c0_g1_i2_m71400 putative pumilio homolog